MERFPTHRHLASWAGMCPGQNESAGKQRPGKTRKRSKWLRSALTESAKAASRTKGSYLSAHYTRIKGRRGHARAHRGDRPLDPRLRLLHAAARCPLSGTRRTLLLPPPAGARRALPASPRAPARAARPQGHPGATTRSRPTRPNINSEQSASGIYDSGGSMEMPQITQVGVVVRDLQATMEAYHAALGWGPWRVYEHRPRRCTA
jgi:Transposase IS116/IS110/IS902 family